MSATTTTLTANSARELNGLTSAPVAHGSCRRGCHRGCSRGCRRSCNRGCRRSCRRGCGR